ncbi:Clavaminate synthase-like protein [Trichodelitschia bisporula]|uniref:Clavaminate synthase-like protein n=1 Tax=Trichodelitschia bisporula TaxID=703511 RepID=A0A6G1HPC0_9PEZI|nr:Clavaminate synthase-like protein [Trichodelitschia bisporula]
MDRINIHIRDLITSYQELNPSTIPELSDPPSALEFMRYAATNRPFILRNGAADFPAVQKWNAAYLREVMNDAPVNVAISAAGDADSVLERPDGELWFIKPCEVSAPFGAVLDAIQLQEQDAGHTGPVLYAQTQNDNLRNEYAPLYADIPPTIPFARIALQRPPDAINFWLGSARSRTALHRDPYENIYVQVLGTKTFTLLPPTEAPCVNEQRLRAGTYVPAAETQAEHEAEGPPAAVYPTLDSPPASIPFPTWDPDNPAVRPSPYSHLAWPIRLMLRPGDMLYLPALWYHAVAQGNGNEGISCSVNYWYDMDYSGAFYSLSGFARGVGLASMGREEDGGFIDAPAT